MLAALEPPPFQPTTGAPATSTTPSWGDIGRSALLDLIHGLTGGSAASGVASKIGEVLGPGNAGGAAAVAAAQRAAAAQQQKQTLMILGGIAGAVVLGALLLRR